MWEPLATVIALAAIAAFFVYAARRGAAIERAQRARLSRARRAQAIVVSVSSGSSSIRRGAQRGAEMCIRLMVEGRPVIARWHVFELGLARMRTGERFPVRVDADDASIVYPAHDWAELSFLHWAAILKSAPRA